MTMPFMNSARARSLWLLGAPPAAPEPSRPTLCLASGTGQTSASNQALRRHRHAARLTLEQLAEASGVSVRTLSDMERGRSRGPRHRTVTALTEAIALMEAIGSHAVYVSQHVTVADLIRQAAT
ncbi:helix-turn-helix domain-containing protein [Nonomuraea sp. NPDC051941]|uniref:helix-turn-helix domain-containing protein n=1 Tax=Nonomuraea sp. NPDC051941 TaxID=3364373 RepID=UPI0037C64204